MNRDTQSVLLALLGGAVVRISLDDTYLRYVKDWTRPYLVVSGALLVTLGLVSLWRERAGRRAEEPGGVPSGVGRPEPAGSAEPAGRAEPAEPAGQAEPAGSAEAGAAAHEDHEHDHSHGPAVAWLLLLPIFAIFLVAPPALGSYSASRATSTVAQPEEGEFAPLPAADPVTTTLTDYATRAIWDEGRSLQGRRVRMVGFVSPRPGGGWHLARLVMSCCAADARPVKVVVQGGQSFPADSWVAVTGTYGGMDDAAIRSEKIPVIRADSVEAVRAPSEPYEG